MDFEKLKKTDEFLDFFDNDERAFKHTYFFHYTTLRNADCILSEKQIRLTPLSKSANDLNEAKVYEEFGNNLFSLCFSTGTSESLPLWYLYSGIDGHGARIGLKKKTLRSLLEKPALYLQEVEGKKPYTAKGEPIALKDEDYNLLRRDILYIGRDPQNPDNYRAKYNGQVNNGLSKELFDELYIRRYRGFIKGLIWFYEKETRVQVEITNKELLHSGKSYVVLLKLDCVYDDISVRLAPEYEGSEKELFEKYDGVRAWAFEKLQKSDFAGQVKMGLADKLCENCSRKRESTVATAEK